MNGAGRRLVWLANAAVLVLLTQAGCVPSPAEQGDAHAPAAAPVSDDELRRKIDEALDATFARRLSIEEHAAWQIVHGAVAFKREFQVEHGGELVSAVDFALAGGRMKGWEFEPGDMLGGRRGLRSILLPGSKQGQGHPDQWFGYLSSCGLDAEQPIVFGGQTYTLADLAAQVEWDAPRNTTREFSWTLMGLSAYRPSDYRWHASDGREWSIEQLLDIECQHDLGGSACGGSHRLVGITLTLNRHLAQGGELTGVWQRADQHVQQAVARAREYQNPDGSFSVNYFQRPGTSADLAQSLSTTGHTFEFVVLAASDEQLREPWVRRAALYLCDAFHRTRQIPLECGGLYHSASGLALYRERLFGPRTFLDAKSSDAVAARVDRD